MTGNHTVAGLLDRALRLLPEDAALDAELLLAAALGQNRAWIKSHAEVIPGAAQTAVFKQLIDRRATGEPLAYILGYRDFWTLRLAVDRRVLVPRPETELLVERALHVLGEREATVADLGTGSGAIALALASERPNWHITATDASADALAVARHNAQQLNLSAVQFVSGSWFEPLAGRRFDLIASNPPYVGGGDPALAQLQHEPHVALTPSAEAMTALRSIIEEAPGHLERCGWLLLEHGYDQAASVGEALVARGFARVRSHRDLAGHERMTEAQWPAHPPDEEP
ncbi:MAG: peptide chain release factor N(5)-glutamine methyltransferase [Sinobacteraceae bacterium]|nr:peptide chain release factor N(5)-glutamine methyltransferase [Nevskiaceae bacterium]